MAETSVLIVDDEPKMSGVLARMLERDGYVVEWYDDPVKALERLGQRPFDIMVSDLRMPNLSGIEMLDKAKRLHPSLDFVMMTAYATPQTAVESMKKGAIDYLIKPFSIDDLRALIRRIEDTRQGSLPAGHDGVADAVAARDLPATPGSAHNAGAYRPAQDMEGIIASSPGMVAVLEKVRKAAASSANILLRGESGTGKEVIARAIHRLSPRARGPLVAVNCGAIPESLMESELFGHVKGAFTNAVENRTGHFEAANGGSIFLDELGEIPPYLQVKLLRVLQEGEVQRVGESVTRAVDVRVIAATNRNLEEDILSSEFRQDLYYRLNVIPIALPPLRERREDIDLLIKHFLSKFTASGVSVDISPAAQKALRGYDYPGNIRELENAIEHAVVLCDDNVVDVSDLPLRIQESVSDSAADYPAGPVPSSHLEEIEKQCIVAALNKTGFNFTRAAQHLGITRRTLGYRIQKYGLQDYVNLQKDNQRARNEDAR